MNRILRLYKSTKTRIRAVLIPTIILLICGAAFVGNEMVQNRAYYVRAYTADQQKMTNQISHQLQQFDDEDEMVSYLTESVEQSGDSWVFLAKGDDVLFARDQATTDTLEKLQKYSFFEKKYSSDTMVFTVTSFGEEGYKVGMVTAVTYALTASKITKHTVYIGMAFAFIAIVFVAVVIILVMKWNNSEKKCIRLQEELVVSNNKIEQVMEQEQVEKDETVVTIKSGQFYDLNMLETLLKKSEDPELRPFSIMILRVMMRDKYYTKKQIFDIMEVVQRQLDPRQLMAEIAKGEFAVLMYKTTKEEAEDLQHRIVQKWKDTCDMKDIKIRIAIASTPDMNQDTDSVYRECLRRIHGEDIESNE